MIHREAAVRTVRSSNGQPAGSRPCAHCGRPVPQPYSGNQIFRYCRDNEGACQRAARRIGLHRVGGPGLGDHVARAVVVTERLEHVVDALNEALHANLSKVIDEDVLAELTRREAFGRSAETWEVANVIVFLASDYASYLTGEVISVSSQHP